MHNFGENQLILKTNIINNIEKYGTIKKYPAGTNIVEPNMEIDRIFYIVEGKVKVFLMDLEGKEKVILAGREKAFFGHEYFFSKSLSQGFIIAVDDCLVCEIYEPKIKKLLEDYPQITVELLDNTSILISKMLLQLEELCFYSSGYRITNFIYSIANNHKYLFNGEIMLPSYFTRNEIAKLVGCSTMSVVRQLDILKELNLVDYFHKKIIVKDINKLNEWLVNNSEE